MEPTIMKRITARWIALLSITALILYLCWMVVAPFVQVLLWAVVLAIISYPLNQRLLRRFKRPSLCAILTMLVLIITLLVPLIFVIIMLLNEAASAAPALQANIREFLDPDAPALAWLRRYANVGPLADPSYLADKLKVLSGAVASRALPMVGNVLEVFVKLIFVLFTLFYLLRDTDRIVPVLRDFMPLEIDQSNDILRRTREIISASLWGCLVIAAVQGSLGGLAFWVLNLPSPFLWGVLMFLFSLIPMAGAFVVWAPAAIWLVITGHWVKALLLTIWGTVVIGLLDNVLRPRLVGQKARMHELVVFFSVLGGLQVFGILGLVVGPVVVAVALALIDVFRRAEAAAGQASSSAGHGTPLSAETPEKGPEK